MMWNRMRRTIEEVVNAFSATDGHFRTFQVLVVIERVDLHTLSPSNARTLRAVQ
jgi:hypothetical protein